MPKREYRPHASEKLKYAYGAAELQTGRRAERVRGWSMPEWKQLRKLAIYLHMMHITGFVDEPDKARSSYFVDVDDMDELALHEAMEEMQEPTWNDDKQMALDAGMALLSKRERQAVEWHIGERMSYEEVADRMNVSVESVYKYVSRAVKKWERLKDKRQKLP